MTDEELQKHDWDKVRTALYDLQAHTEEHEPYALMFLDAIEEVLRGIPKNE